MYLSVESFNLLKEKIRSRNTPKKSFFLTPVDSTEIEKYLLKLNKPSTHNLGNITNSMLKYLAAHIALPLAFVFNLLFTSGVYPSLFKKAIVIPLFKNGDRKVMSNYRPIALTLSLSKILEKCIKTRLMTFFKANRIISGRQFGFQKELSTEHALFDMYKLITEKCNEGFFVLGMFLDVRKAFDSLHHGTLLHILYQCGIRGLPYELMKSYLTDRSQVTRIGNSFSSTIRINWGVPQGTVLGPILFLLYVNELMNLNLSSKVFGFADDTAIIFCSKNYNELMMIGGHDLNIIRTWMDYNNLCHNIDKTSIVRFSGNSRRELLLDETIQLHSYGCDGDGTCGCPPIPFSQTCNYLGVVFDSKLTFELHINT